MEFSKQDMKLTKGVAILFMLLLHLFARKAYEIHGLYIAGPTIHGVPLLYFLAIFGDACVPMYCFASGYGLFVSYSNQNGGYNKKNLIRLLKLLTNFWLILLLFVLIGFITGHGTMYPGTPTNFIMNFFLLSYSYNGAWWFLQTYFILVFLSPLIFSLVKKYNSYLIIVISGIIYFLAYLQRIKFVINFGHNNTVLAIVNAMVLIGTSQLPFIVGAVFAKDKIYSRIYYRFYHIRYKNIYCVIAVGSLLFLHGIIQSMFIAPFTGLIFVCLLNLMNKKFIVEKILDFFGTHSTNVWLMHMFFYLTIFPNLTFAPKYPILIYAWLIFMCLFSSYFINLIYKPFLKIIDNKILKSTNVSKEVVRVN